MSATAPAPTDQVSPDSDVKKTRIMPTQTDRARSLRDRLARVHSRFLKEDIAHEAAVCTVPGLTLKVICAQQLLDEARASLSTYLRTEAAK